MSLSHNSIVSFFLPFPYPDTLDLPPQKDQDLFVASVGFGVLALTSGLLRLVNPLPSFLGTLAATSLAARLMSQLTIRQTFEAFSEASGPQLAGKVSAFDMHLARISPALMNGLLRLGVNTFLTVTDDQGKTIFDDQIFPTVYQMLLQQDNPEITERLGRMREYQKTAELKLPN